MAAQRPSLDSVTTINNDGSRPFIYPADVSGIFSIARKVSAFLLIALYLSLPWIKIGGFPAVFLDVANRRFHLFGWTFAAQDMWLTFFLISGLGFSLFFITALLGRIWCGWACPQTVFLDHVYRRIERWIEGNAIQRRKLADGPWTPEKVSKRVVKHGLYIIVSLLITHLFLAYFVSLKELWSMMHEQPAEHWSAFVFVFLAAGVLYFNFAWFREQLCIVICPYGRLQSAMIDDHSLIVGYDAKRGEPRGKLGTTGTGDCVDCNRCVHVCPTGIDIRQGLQMECIGCTACIDACDDVMRRIHKPTGLIRYDSQTALAGGKTRWWRPRTMLYGVLLVVGISVASWAVSTLKPANASITRITGAPYIVTEDAVRNQFLIRLLNKRAEITDFIVRVDSPVPVKQTGFEDPVIVGPIGEEVRPLVLRVPRTGYAGSFKFTITISDVQQSFSITREVEFLGPDARLLKEDEEDDDE
ncbi:MAG: cytochrome c oxidase accessory protein CcoG [Opitutaceae bacterium]|nr:cytochrome c oxidase accessory protein CcoG [Cephaloticoccus sp.]MCP5531148.1 cytochrome c oxidase accessory protein CcoG [Opitutaceae bacterium]